MGKKFSSSITQHLKPNFRPAFYSSNTLGKILSKLKDPIPKSERSGVYKLKCSDCEAVYIGETGRQLSVRVREHVHAFTENKPKKSAFAAHLIQNNHSFQEGMEVLLHEENDFRKRLALETIEITRHNSDDNITLLNEFVPEHSLIEKIYDRRLAD